MNRILFGMFVVLGLSTQSYAMSDAIMNKVADILVTKINADKEVALKALASSPKITIDGEVFNHVTIGEDAVVIGNAGVLLLGDVEIGSITNIVELKKNSVVIGNAGIVVGGG